MPDLGETVAMEGQSGTPATLVNPCFESTHVGSTGDWNTAGSWSAQGVPEATENIRITGTITLSAAGTAKHIVIEDAGRLILAASAVLTCTTIVNNGRFDMQPGSELVFRDEAMDEADVSQFWNGLVCINESVVSIAGTPKSVSHFRFEANAAAATVVLDSAPSGWLAGDRIYLPGTRRFTESATADAANDWWQEFRAIDSIDGATITLDEALTNAHTGMTGTDPRTDIAYHFKPVIQNLTRDTVIRSANPLGVRGHTLFSHRCSVDIQYTEFRDLGRSVASGDLGAGEPGAVRGRYALHMHHCYGPVGGMANGYAFTLHGNSINNVGASPTQGGMPVTWALTIHDCHYGKVTNNDVNNYFGSGFTTEEGNETRNLIEGNRVMWGRGDGERVDVIGGDDFALSGTAYWLGGPNNYVRNNIAANAVDSGPYCWGFNFMVQGRSITQSIPTAIGQDPGEDGLSVNIHSLPILQFEDNEVFSCNGVLTFWWIGAQFETPRGPAGVIKNFHGWNWYSWGIFPYETNRMTVDGAVMLCEPGVSDSSCWEGATSGDYMVRNARVLNFYFQGSISLPGNMDGRTGNASGIAGKSIDPRYGKMLFKNGTAGSVSCEAPYSVNGGSALVGRRVTMDNVHLTAASGSKISMVDGFAGASRNFIVDDYIIWRSYQGDPESNFITQRASKPPRGRRLADVGDINAKIYELPQAKVSIPVGGKFLTMGVG